MQEQIEGLYSSKKSTFELIDVSIYAPPYIFTLRPNSSLIQAVVKHSQDKDQFLKVSIKRMQETPMYENELKEANEYNSVLFAQLRELEAECAEESRLKEGKFLFTFLSCNPVISEHTMD
jgi:hypothetical protein